MPEQEQDNQQIEETPAEAQQPAAEVLEDHTEEELISATPSPEDNDGEESDRAWYVVHCYSGYENKVHHNLLQRIESMGMQDRIFDVVVPTEEEIEV